MSLQIRSSKWILTDDDCAQYVRNLDEFKGNVFELWQVCGVLDMFAVAHAFININDYSEDEIEDVLHYYSYENLDDFVQEISPATIERKADGTLDRESPNYIVEWQLIAEMLFETEALYRHLVPGKDEKGDNNGERKLQPVIVPFPVSWTVKMKKKQKETQDILSYHTQAAGCSDKARAKASGGRQPIEECGRTGL